MLRGVSLKVGPGDFALKRRGISVPPSASSSRPRMRYPHARHEAYLAGSKTMPVAEVVFGLRATIAELPTHLPPALESVTRLLM